MILSILTLHQRTLNVEVDAAEKVGDLKQRIFEKYGEEYIVERQKLIWAGLFLEDLRTLDSYKIDEKKPIVLLTKPKDFQKKLPKSEIQPRDFKEAQPVFGEMIRETNAIAEDEYEKAVRKLVEMGFRRSLVEIALNVSYKNPEWALDYLLNNSSTKDDKDGRSHSDFQQSTASREAKEYQERLGKALVFLHSNREFQEFRKLVRQSPDFLIPLLSRLRDSNPKLYQWISENEDAFVLAINEPDSDISAEGSSSAIQNGCDSKTILEGNPTLSMEERGAVNRLTALGFSEEVAIEAYIACDRNEILAANFLLEYDSQM